MSFPCTRCGACCARVHGEPWLSQLPILEDGSCAHYDPSTKECKIFEARPDICRMDLTCPPRCWERQEEICDRFHLRYYGVPRERGEDCKHVPGKKKMKERVLVLGAGSRKTQAIFTGDALQQSGPNFTDNFKDVWTIDMEPAHAPKITWDLNRRPWPVPDEHFDEVHAYEVLEHLGSQGDFGAFFGLWREIWRVLKPNGFLCATTPWWQSIWVYSDPGHSVVYSPALLYYFSQKHYEEVGITTMTDYRRWWPKPYNFETVFAAQTHTCKNEAGEIIENPSTAGFLFCLRKLEVREKTVESTN